MQFHLQWLHDTLLAAERANEKVHILSHIPSNSCFRFYAREFRRIVDRFHMTISAIFIGHSHREGFNVMYARNSINFAINNVWFGGATTSYSSVNPNYILYYVDRTLFVSLT
jgi:sphingomyelin phosphodiesterase